MTNHNLGLLRAILATDDPSETAKQFKVGTGTVKEVVRQAKEMYGIGHEVKILHTSYEGIVVGYNESDFGIYTGDRFPLMVKITSTQSNFTEAYGKIFEYGLSQIQDLEEYNKTPRWYAIFGYKSVDKGAVLPINAAKDIAAAANLEILHHRGTHIEFIRIPSNSDDREIVEEFMNDAKLHWELVGSPYGV